MISDEVAAARTSPPQTAMSQGNTPRAPPRSATGDYNLIDGKHNYSKVTWRVRAKVSAIYRSITPKLRERTKTTSTKMVERPSWDCDPNFCRNYASRLPVALVCAEGPGYRPDPARSNPVRRGPPLPP